MARKRNQKDGRLRASDEELREAASRGKRRQAKYVFPDGLAVTLQAVSAPLIYELQSDIGKPAPTKTKTFVLAGGARVERPDYDDPDYKAALADWELRKTARFARTLILEGVVEFPPADVYAYWAAAGRTDEYDVKYAWISSRLHSPELEEHFFSTLLGLSIPTEEGIEEAEELFPGDVHGNGQEPEAAGHVETEAEDGQEGADS